MNYKYTIYNKQINDKGVTTDLWAVYTLSKIFLGQIMYFDQFGAYIFIPGAFIRLGCDIMEEIAFFLKDVNTNLRASEKSFPNA